MNAPFQPTGLKSKLRKMGNSTGMIVPKPILDQLGLRDGVEVELRIENGEVIARPTKRKVREGWAEDAERIGKLELTAEERDWIDFPNDFDETEWQW